MRFCLGNDMRFCNGIPFKSKSVAAIGVCTDTGDARNAGFYLAVELDGRRDAFADDMRNNAGLPSRISSPYDGTLLFFWT